MTNTLAFFGFVVSDEGNFYNIDTRDQCYKNFCGRKL